MRGGSSQMLLADGKIKFSCEWSSKNFVARPRVFVIDKSFRCLCLGESGRLLMVKFGLLFISTSGNTVLRSLLLEQNFQWRSHPEAFFSLKLYSNRFFDFIQNLAKNNNFSNVIISQTFSCIRPYFANDVTLLLYFFCRNLVQSGSK